MVRVLSPYMATQVLKLADMSPSAQKLVIGATGIVSHTAIDAINPFADDDTRKYAAVRSAVRILICTTSGLITREIGQKLGEYAVKTGKLTTPEGITKIAFASSVGKIFAIMGAVVSIFAIDVPFVNKLMNLVMKKIFPDRVPQDKKTNNEKQVRLNA